MFDYFSNSPAHEVGRNNRSPYATSGLQQNQMPSMTNSQGWGGAQHNSFTSQTPTPSWAMGATNHLLGQRPQVQAQAQQVAMPKPVNPSVPKPTVQRPVAPGGWTSGAVDPGYNMPSRVTPRNPLPEYFTIARPQ